jgi:hypothetical protein
MIEPVHLGSCSCRWAIGFEWDTQGNKEIENGYIGVCNEYLMRRLQNEG